MSYTTEVELTLTLRLKGDHKGFTTKELDGFIDTKRCQIIKAAVLKATSTDLGSKVDQIVRNQNLYKKIIMDAMPKFLVNKCVKAGKKRWEFERYKFSITTKDTSTWASGKQSYFGYIQFKDDNTVVCHTSDGEEHTIFLSDPKFVDQLREAFKCKELEES
jgi:hypothetical protein